MAAACAAVLDDDEPEPLRPQKTCYEVNGVTLSVEGSRREAPRRDDEAPAAERLSATPRMENALSCCANSLEAATLLAWAACCLSVAS